MKNGVVTYGKYGFPEKEYGNWVVTYGKKGLMGACFLPRMRGAVLALDSRSTEPNARALRPSGGGQRGVSRVSGRAGGGQGGEG